MKNHWVLKPVVTLNSNETPKFFVVLEGPDVFTDFTAHYEVVDYSLYKIAKAEARKANKELLKILDFYKADRKLHRLIHCSNSNVRFYVKDGWSGKDLKPFVVREELNYFKSGPNSYYFLKPGCIIDFDKLFQHYLIKVRRAFDKYPEEPDLAYLKKFNWGS